MGRGTGILKIVSTISLWSFRFAPSTVIPRGIPAPSVSRLRFVPSLARSVGLGPVFFPPEGRLGHCPIHREPAPINTFVFIVVQEPLTPDFVEYTCFQPLTEPSVRGGARADPRRIQGVPLAASAEHEQNGRHRVSVRDPRPVASQRMHRPRWQQRLDLGPQLVRQFPALASRRLFHGLYQAGQIVDCAIF